MAIEIPLSGKKHSDQKQVETFNKGVLEQASQIPGIQEFALSNGLPIDGSSAVTFARADQPQPAHGQEPFSFQRIVTPTYFHLLGIPILNGRAFTDRDNEGSRRVAIVNENLAKAVFGGESPVGKQLLILGERDGTSENRMEIVGVAANATEVGRNEVPFNDIYVPISQNPTSQMHAIAKTRSPYLIGPILRRKIQNLDPEQFVDEGKLLDSYVAREMQSSRFNFGFVAAFASLALLLTGVALFGTMSFAVAQRARDIGVRIALGAGRADVIGLIARYVFRITIAGSICGVGLALVTGAMLGNSMYMVPYQHEGILYGVSIHDPLTLSSVHRGRKIHFDVRGLSTAEVKVDIGVGGPLVHDGLWPAHAIATAPTDSWM